MKFSCDSCGAQYQIGDEKLGSRGVKVRCKRCGHMIVVRPPGFVSAPASATSAPGEAKTETTALENPVSWLMPDASDDSAWLDPADGPLEMGVPPEEDYGFPLMSPEGVDARDEGVALAPSEEDEPSTQVIAAPERWDMQIPETRTPSTVRGPSTATDGPTEEPWAASEAIEGLAPERDGRDFGPMPGIEQATRAMEADRVAALARAAEEALADEAADVASERGTEDVFTQKQAEDEEPAWGEPVVSAPDDGSVAGGPREAARDRAEFFQTKPAAEVGPEAAAAEEAGSRSRLSTLSALAAADDLDEDEPDDNAPEGTALREISSVDDLESGLAAVASPLASVDDLESGSAVAGPLASVDDLESGVARPLASVDDLESGLAAVASPLTSVDDLQSGMAAVESAPPSGDDAQDAGEDASLASGLTSHPEGGEVSTEAQLGDAFQAIFAPDAPPSEALVEPGLVAAPSTGTPPPMNNARSKAEWYVAIDDEQVGPLTYAEVKERWTAGALGPDSLSWRAGMADWTPIRQVTDLAELAASPSSKPSTSGLAFGATGNTTGEMAPAIALGEGSNPAVSATAGPDGWRPTAASALASLAAEELSDVPEPPSNKPTTGKMTAIPTVSNELSRLIEGGVAKEGTASMFGRAEQSVSKVRALPRRSETLAAGNLAEHHTSAFERHKRPIVVASGVAAVLLFGVGARAMFGGGDSEAPRSAHTASTPVQQHAAAAPAASPDPAPPPRAPEVPEPKLATAALQPAERPSKPVPKVSPTPASAQEPLAAAPPPAVEASSLVASAGQAPPPRKSAEEDEPKATSDASAVARASAPAKKKKKVRSRKRKPVAKKRRSYSSKKKRRAPPEKTPSPKPAPRGRRASSVDDLLAGAVGQRSKPAPEPKLPSKLDDIDVLRVLRKHRPQVRDCISRHQKANGPTGRVKVTITIRPSGRVSNTRFEPRTFNGSPLGKCLSGHARSWRFPKFAGSAMPVYFPVVVK